MQFIRVVFVAFILWKRFHLTNQQNDVPSNPCPHLFQYKFDGNNWMGEIELPSPPLQHSEVILQLTLSLRGHTTPENVGTITIVGGTQEVTNKIINGEPITFHVRFPYGLPIPKVVRIVYDDKLLCTGPEEQMMPNTVVSRIELKHVMNTYTTYTPGIQNYDQTRPSQGSNFGQNQGFGGQYTPPNTFGPSTNNFPTMTSSFPNQGGSNQVMMRPGLMPLFTNRPTYRPTYEPTYTTQTSTLPPPPRPTTTNAPSYSRPAFPVSNTDVNSICGTRHSESEITPLVFGGEETQRGDWPWMVAIYLNKPTGLSFNCGGTLISSKTVISAAHCINTSTKHYRANEVVLYLGRYSLIDWSEVGSVASNVEKIIIHADYKRQRESYDADIAIMIMTKQVEFNEFVRPACLWPGVSSVQELEGKKGVVVGWGKDGTDHVVSKVPKKIDLPIVNSITCVQTSESLSKAVSNRTFCAGTLDGDGPCHGDSGGGLTLYHKDRWTLRGIVSAGLSDANTGACKLMDYVVFTDVSLFTSWIQINSIF